ncbi:DUF429 domain-containing protein [bacterium]|nr:DUF429 domain-containing protein [bacterium]
MGRNRVVVAGVDGCKGGWLVALWERGVELILCADFAGVVEVTRDCRAVAVDMPIGLALPGQTRGCDRAARKLLGRKSSSVFSAPPREALDCTDYQLVRGWGMSLQSFYLLPKVREVDAWMTPERQLRVSEAHPELVWARLAGAPVLASKKTLEGASRVVAMGGACVEVAAQPGAAR